MRNPHVLVVTPDFPPARGGIQILSHQVVNAFKQLDPVVITIAHHDASEFDRDQPFPVRRIAPVPGLRRATVLALNASAFVRGMRCLPDVVLSTHIVASPAATLLKRWAGVPFVQYVHAKEVGAKPGLARFALTRADRVIAVSRYTKTLTQSLGADDHRIVCINPGVVLPARAPSGSAKATRPTILTVARLEDRYKGHDVMLRALPLIRARIRDFEWVVLGDGPLRPALERQAAATGLSDHVRFLGSVSDSERDDWLQRSHVFSMVSRLPAGGFAGEGFGIVYLEANAHRLPVVAGRVGGALDAVVDGVTGLLVNPEDHVDVADALTRILTDPDLAERLGSAGQQRAEDFAWPVIGAQVETALLEVVR